MNRDRAQIAALGGWPQPAPPPRRDPHGIALRDCGPCISDGPRVIDVLPVGPGFVLAEVDVEELLTLTDHFRYFLQVRPSISPARLAVELGFDRANLQKIIIGKREIPQSRRGDFYRLMLRYGYSEAAALFEHCAK